RDPLWRPAVGRRATPEDLADINRIYNHEVQHGVATWDLDPWPWERRLAWFGEHDDTTPIFVAEVDSEVAGFNYLSHHSPRAGYRFTREHTIYIDERFQGRGVGRALLSQMVEEARRLGMHVLLAAMESENTGSLVLHRSLGFVEL